MTASLRRLLTLLLMASAVVALPACAATAPSTDASRLWGRALLDTYFDISLYLTQLETIRDAFDAGVGVPNQCDPAKSKGLHTNISQQLDQLKARASAEDLKDALGLQEVWANLRRTQLTWWKESEGLEPRERCLKTSLVAASRVDVERIVKATVDRRFK